MMSCRRRGPLLEGIGAVPVYLILETLFTHRFRHHIDLAAQRLRQFPLKLFHAAEIIKAAFGNPSPRRTATSAAESGLKSLVPLSRIQAEHPGSFQLRFQSTQRGDDALAVHDFFLPGPLYPVKHTLNQPFAGGETIVP